MTYIVRYYASTLLVVGSIHLDHNACNLGVDEPRRGEVVPLVAGVEPPFAVDDFFTSLK